MPEHVPVQPQQLVKADYAPGQILIKYREMASAQAMQSVRQRIKANIIHRFPQIASKLQLQQLPSGMNVEQVVASLKMDPNVEYAEPNYVYHISGLAPNDPYFNLLWGLNNTGQSGGAAGIDISALRAWEMTTGSSEVVVGIVDTGIDYLHEDLAANMWTNPGEIPDNKLDDDGNGFVDDVHGWNADDGNGDPMDDNDHGTHVAGTIGAAGNNNEGIVGINWNTKLMALKFLDAEGSGYVSGAIECIEYAVAMKRRGVNIRVLNASWGGEGNSDALRSAIEAAGEAGILFVAAAGNNGDGSGERGTDDDVAPIYPASYDLANIVSVAAVDRRGHLAAFSNYGAKTVDLAAPGVSIASTIPSDRYAYFSGTSMATPHVSGVAALLAAVKPQISTDELKNALLQGAVPLASLEKRTLTGGMLNAFNSLQLVSRKEPPPADFNLSFSTVRSSIRAGESGDFGLLVRSTGGFGGPVTLSARLNLDPGGISQHWSSNPVDLPTDGQASVTLTLATTGDSLPGLYTLTVEGVSSDRSQRVSLNVTIEPAFPDPKPGDPGEAVRFTLAVAPASRPIPFGGWASYTIKVNRATNSDEPINLNVFVRGDNQGLSLMTLYPNPVKGGQAVVYLWVSPSAPRREARLFVRGTSSTGVVVDSNDFAIDIR
ncbi:MAG: S8 family serine peptidase [Acidobacteria bacterium]|nr:S8 family serine peptidase [Acidobacteriota bacterium]